MFYQHRPIKGLKTRITQTHTCHNVKMKTKQQQKLDTALKRIGQLEMLNTPRVVRHVTARKRKYEQHNSESMKYVAAKIQCGNKQRRGKIKTEAGCFWSRTRAEKY